MALPTSLWVKFKDDQIKVTYLGVEYTLVHANEIATWKATVPLSGTLDDGSCLYIYNDGCDWNFSSDDTNININVCTFVAGENVASTAVAGAFAYENWAVTSVSGSIAAATIIHRDSMLPKLLEVPFETEEDETHKWHIWNGSIWSVGVNLAVGENGNSRFIVLLEGVVDLLNYSFSLDANNVGTTDCPFVEFIGELATVETFTENGTWTPPANIDTTKPVIVECLGAGANGYNGTFDGSDQGGDGGGGGGYASYDLHAWATETFGVVIDEAISNIGNLTHFDFCAAQGGIDNLGGAGVAGDVIFIGGDAAAGDGTSGGAGGKAAKPYADGEDYAGPAGATVDDNAASATEPGDGGGGGFGIGAKTAGGTGLGGYVKIHYSLQTIVNGDTEVEIIELNEVYDNIEVTFATGGIPRKRGINSHSMISGVRANVDIDRVD